MPEKEAEEKQKLVQISEISLSLDNYDDIFSDFDPRPYSQRALSDDFLIEAKKASKDKPSGGIELKFLMPQEQRNPANENVIKKRLREHFKKHANLLAKEYKQTIHQGVWFASLGIALMLITSILFFKYTSKSLFISFLIVFLEPASWFLFWEGLRLVIFETKTKKPEHDFYNKMSKCEVNFISY